jgi:hypothetical protein
MILFASNRSELLNRFLVEDGVGKVVRFWKLADKLHKRKPICRRLNRCSLLCKLPLRLKHGLKQTHSLNAHVCHVSITDHVGQARHPLIPSCPRDLESPCSPKFDSAEQPRSTNHEAPLIDQLLIVLLISADLVFSIDCPANRFCMVRAGYGILCTYS